MDEDLPCPGRRTSSGVLGLIAALLLSGCFGQTDATTTADSSGGRARLKAFAFKETRKQARRTCAAVPREALAAGFLARSEAPPAGRDPARYDDNFLALLHVEHIRLNPIRLQTRHTTAVWWVSELRRRPHLLAAWIRRRFPSRTRAPSSPVPRA